MKWGVRKAVDTAIGTKTAGRRPSRTQKAVTKSRAFKSFSKASDKNVQRHFARQTARRERRKIPTKGVALGRSSRKFRAQYPTGKLQAKAIHHARKEARTREKAIRQMKKKDSVEAARF